MKILVFQHNQIEGLENIKKILKKNQISITFVKFYEKYIIPKNLEQFSMMIVLGGPMDTFMEDSYPWLKEEKKIIKEFVVDLQKPFLGICLGCQLLGEVLGGIIKKSSIEEVGFCDVYAHNEIKKDNLFKYFPEKFKVFQLHSYEVTKIKSKDVKVLISSSSTKYQLFRYKNNAYGMQFHLEVLDKTIEKWLSNKENMNAFKTIPKILRERNIKEYNQEIIKIRNLCENFMGKFIYLAKKNPTN